jgi:hypothetical protein
LPRDACAAELARLEWTIVEVTHAAEGVGLPASLLAHFDPKRFARVRFDRSPAPALIEQHYPVHEYYAACLSRRDRALSEARRNVVLVRRRGATVVREELERPRAELLRALLAGDTVASALQRAADSGMAMAGAYAAIRRFLAHGCFADLRPG